MSLILKIDIRETALINLCRDKISKTQTTDYELITEQMPIGDIIICNNDELNPKEYLIIERKTLADLASSIKDGRYEEQSYRLNGIANHNHNIMYLIEGDLNGIVMKTNKNKIDTKMLYSAMFSLNYYKGFSVMRTKSLDETADFICNICSKLKRDLAKGRKAYYCEPTTQMVVTENENENENANIDSNENENTNVKSYCTVIKKNKKENITKENIGEIILCQIPGVSSTIAIEIMKKYKTINSLIYDINNNPNCLDELKTTDKNGKQRKISKTAISTIINFFAD